jgi:hypothetical protein
MKFTGTKNYVSTEDLSMAVNATIALGETSYYQRGAWNWENITSNRSG